MTRRTRKHGRQTEPVKAAVPRGIPVPDRKTKQRIQPARIRDLPSVLDAEETANVLRVSVETVRKLRHDGQLRSLRYSRTKLLFDSREVLRFLREESEPESQATTEESR